MVVAHHLGFPRIGLKRDLKWALENYWKGEISQDALIGEGKRIRHFNWQLQLNAGHDFLTVGDFSWYDHVLDLSALLGVIPQRFQNGEYDLDTYFRMARGRAPTGKDTHALEMTKWFDTNYHYMVPELHPDTTFAILEQKLFLEITDAKLLGKVKPVILGPLSYLWLGKEKEASFDKLSLLKNLTKTYKEILTRIRDMGVEWVQIDEPILALDLNAEWKKAFADTYEFLQIPPLKLMLTTYFGDLDDNAKLAAELPTAGLHVDIVRGTKNIDDVVPKLSAEKVLSVGIVDGRNIWKNDLRKSFAILQSLQKQFENRLWVGSSCSLLHSPVDLNSEEKLDAEIKSWLSFATQKLDEIAILSKGLNEGEASIAKELNESDAIQAARRSSTRIHNPSVKAKCQNISPSMTQRKNVHSKRKMIQKELFGLPQFPTTTIGSFPQTQEIRALRNDYKSAKIPFEVYQKGISAHIANAIQKQMDLDLDVLVHGEAERNDMVEYFGELLEGFAFTQNGWVQSYGSRCVKPPIIFGDVNRPYPMTVEWAEYAQTLTKKPVKGMLTGPITILCWSFVRDDQSRFETAKQIAVALRDEVQDLTKSGIHIIQIDEPAFREGLPLRERDWQPYLQQAVFCFRVASCGVEDSVQIHTHMCYSEFNDTIEAIADLDADVITIETSRSDMELLKAFENFQYPNDIGPGVYDIHSPRIPSVDEIIQLMEKAIQSIPVDQLWINPDCGLKTRDWKETELALKNMVEAAKILRERYAFQAKYASNE